MNSFHFFHPKSSIFLAEITSIKSRSDSIDSAHLPLTTTTSSTNQRNKAGPPVSYPKHYYPPPSTTSVVKQLINHSATLVYDSSSAQKSSIKPKPLIKSATINLEQTREELINTNVDLTGRQLLPEHRKKKVRFIERKRKHFVCPYLEKWQCNIGQVQNRQKPISRSFFQSIKKKHTRYPSKEFYLFFCHVKRCLFLIYPA